MYKLIVVLYIQIMALSQEIDSNYLYIEEIKHTRSLGSLVIIDYKDELRIDAPIIDYLDLNSDYYQMFETIC